MKSKRRISFKKLISSVGLLIVSLCAILAGTSCDTEDLTNTTTSTTEESSTSETTSEESSSESTSEETTSNDQSDKLSVTFDTNGGSEVETQYVKSGELATEPSAPTKASTNDNAGTITSYTFEGWYADSSFETVFDFTVAITENTTVYAKWSETTSIADGYKEVNSSVNLADFASYVGTVSSDLSQGIWTIQSGTTIRSRSRGWEQKTYEEYPYLNTHTTLDGETSIADLSAFTYSVKLTATAGVSVTTPGNGYLAFYVQNGSSGATEQYVTVTDSDGNSTEYTIPGTNYSSPCVQLNVECEAGKTYTITRNSGTVDLYYAECYCIAEESEATGISIANEGTTDYLINTELDTSDLTVNLNYANGTTEALSQDQYTIDTSKVDMTTAGTYDITITYGSYTATYTITVYGIDSIVLGFNGIEKLSTTTSAGNGVYYNQTVQYIYNVGSSVNFEYLTITAVAANDDEFIFEYDSSYVTYSTVDTSTAGTKTVTVTLTLGTDVVEATFDIYVVDAELITTTVDSVTEANVYVDSSYTGVIGETSLITIDGTNLTCNTFTTIEQALEYLELQSDATSIRKNIYIAPGTYNEKLEITLPYVSLIGLGDATDSSDISNAVLIEWDSLYGETDEAGFSHTTDSTQTVSVRESAIGCIINNIVISNYWNSLSRFAEREDSSTCDHRALALLVQADQFILENSQLLGYQDTVELFLGRQYIYNTYISGTTDFIFGTNNTTYFYDCEIHSISNGSSTQGGYITAFKGNNKDASDAVTYGAIFDNCNFTADDDVPAGLTAIGRCWGAYAAVATINSTIGGHVSTAESTGSSKNERYVSMNASPLTETVQFVEYNNTGDGAISATQAGMTYLDSETAAKYSDISVIFGIQNGGVTYAEAWDPSNQTIAVDDKTYYYFNGNNSATGTSYTYTGNVNSATDTKTTTLGGLTIDASNGGKVTSRGTDTQCNAGATISFEVEANTQVIVTTYPSYHDYKITGSVAGTYTAGSDTMSMFFEEAQTVTISFVSTVYLYSIILNPNEEGSAPAESSISLSGMTTSLTIGSEFTYGDLAVSVVYDNKTSKSVDIADCTIDSSEVDMTTAGTYNVFVTYNGLEAEYQVTVEEDNIAFTQDTEVTFGSAGNYSTVAKMDTSNATLRDNGSNNTQFSSGTISFYVLGGSSITVTGYSGYTSYTLTANGTTSGEITDITYTYTATDDTKVVLTPVNASNYIISVAVTVPEAVRETTSIEFGSAGNYADYVDLTSASYRDNGTNNSQLSGTVTFSVNANATVTINGYPNYTSYTVAYGSVTSDTITDSTYSFTVSEFSTITLVCGSNNYFYSISVYYPVVISETTSIVFSTSGNYADYVDSSNATYTEVKSSTAAFKGSISFTVAAYATVAIDVYGGSYSAYTLSYDGLDYTDDTTFTVSEQTTITLTSSGSCYINSITVTVPNVIQETTTITFSSTGNYADYVDMTNGSWSEIKSSTAAFTGTMAITVAAGATVAIDVYGGSYSSYTLNGTAYTDDTTITVDELTVLEFVATGSCYINSITITF